ncbi:MAG TPA: aminoglycoside 3'-phosphotransferase [Acidimicrobiales bacterium]
MISGPPNDSVQLPEALERLVNGRTYDAVWLNEIGGWTLHLEEEASSFFLKWAPRSNGDNLLGEVERLAWASSHLRVPVVVESGSNDEGSWFYSQPIDGQNAVSAKWKLDPQTATTAIGRGLRALHDALDVESCPFEWSVDRRRRDVQRRFREGLLSEHVFGWELRGLTVEEAMEELGETPREDLVVCHGDACAPNTLLDDAGEWTAHVDLGRLGVGDRWADLAIASWSTVWNYGPGWEENVYDAYGIEPDAAKIRFYRLLWDLD